MTSTSRRFCSESSSSLFCAIPCVLSSTSTTSVSSTPSLTARARASAVSHRLGSFAQSLVSHLLLMINSSVNFLVYCVAGTRFRVILAQKCRKKLRSCLKFFKFCRWRIWSGSTAVPLWSRSPGQLRKRNS